MNRWTHFASRQLAVTAATLIGFGSTVATFAQEDDPTVGEAIEAYDYQENPIFLDEPEPQPPASLVEKRVDTSKYADDKVWVEREIARYSDNRFVADGFYREFFPNGQKFAEGQYKNGKQQGEWTYWHENGQVCRKVNYQDGQPNGSWDVMNAEGVVIAKRSFKNGKRDGTWVVYDKTGKQPLREEQYSEGKGDGVWKTWFPSGQQKTQIGLKMGTRHGPAIEWDEKGTQRIEIPYVDGKAHGTVKLVGADGQKIVQQYDHGKLVNESQSE
jgi:antitoxin component YwqK of YwqJK toxin-antitoxin module